MTKSEFKDLFIKSLDICVRNVELTAKKEIPRNVRILLYGANHSGEEFSVDEAIDILFITNNTFYKIIDLSVIRIGETFITVFTRVSGHRPGTFEESWNQPFGAGPFRQLISDEIEEVNH